MKFKVTKTNIIIDGKKYRRGDVVSLDNPNLYGTWVEPYHEPAVEIEKPKRKRRTKAEMEAARLFEVQDEII